MKYGYARVSTEQQNLNRQLDMLRDYGVDRIYQEKITGTTKEREELKKMIASLREGDEVVIESLSRLARSVKDLLELIDEITSKGASLKSMKENIDCETATGRLLINLISAINQFERDIISQRTQEGLASTKKRGTTLGRPKIDSSKIENVKELVNGGMSISEACRVEGISRAYYYKSC